MRFFTAILLPCAMIFVLGLLPTSSIQACNGKKQAHKTQVKCSSKCQKNCCKKLCSDPKKKKKGCCGDDCSCAPNLVVLADLPNVLPIYLSKRRIIIEKSTFFYKNSFPISTIQDIWQPPITVFSI